MRGGEDVDAVDDKLGLPLACESCDWRLDERTWEANCSGMAGLGGRSPMVFDPLDIDTRRVPVARSSTLGLRFRVVSGNCSVLDLGVVDDDALFDIEPLLELAARPLADFQDFRIDLRTLLLSAGALDGGCCTTDGGRCVCCEDGLEIATGGGEGDRITLDRPGCTG